jgi:hypothetical protein
MVAERPIELGHQIHFEDTTVLSKLPHYTSKVIGKPEKYKHIISSTVKPVKPCLEDHPHI